MRGRVQEFQKLRSTRFPLSTTTTAISEILIPDLAFGGIQPTLRTKLVRASLENPPRQGGPTLWMCVDLLVHKLVEMTMRARRPLWSNSSEDQLQNSLTASYSSVSLLSPFGGCSWAIPWEWLTCRRGTPARRDQNMK